MERDFANLSEKYIAVTKLMNELQSKVDGLTGEGGGVNELREQVKNLQDTWQQLQSKAGVMYRPVFVESGKTVRAKNADEGILVIVRSGYAVIVSPFNTSGTLQGINDLTTGEELYNGADAPLMHNLLIPRGAADGRGDGEGKLVSTYVKPADELLVRAAGVRRAGIVEGFAVLQNLASEFLRAIHKDIGNSSHRRLHDAEQRKAITGLRAAGDGHDCGERGRGHAADEHGEGHQKREQLAKLGFHRRFPPL